MATTKTNPHGWLFAYLQPISADAQELAENRKALVKDYSGGKTESLSELYNKHPRLYAKMRTALSTPKDKRSDDSLDIHRKRLMAAIFERLEDQGIKGKTYDYVKSVACKAAQVDRFNDIPLPTLQSLYRKFGEKNLNKYDDQVKELISTTI